MKEFFRRNPRIGGAFMTVIALVMAKFFMLDVAIAAQAHSDHVSLSMKAILFSIVFFMFGVFLLVTGPFGDNMMRAAPGSQKLSPLGWITVVIAVGLSFGGYFLFKQYIESFGYQF